MQVVKTNIVGVVIIEPRLFKDEREYFFDSFSQREFDELALTYSQPADSGLQNWRKMYCKTKWYDGDGNYLCFLRYNYLGVATFNMNRES